MTRRFVVVVVKVLLIMSIAISCTRWQSETPLTLEQLFANPGKYNGKTVTLEAFYFHGWETIVLSERVEPSGYAPGHLVPKGRLIWVESGIPKEIYDALYVQQMMGPAERIGKLKVKGKFEYGGKYGHVGGFDAQIVPSEVELLPWSLPK